MSAAMLALLFIAATGVDEPARKEEEAAFQAVREERWCDAWRGFLRAYDLAPADELLFDAGLAAEHAGDVDAARALFERVPPTSAKGDTAHRHVVALASTQATARCEAHGEAHGDAQVAAPATNAPDAPLPFVAIAVGASGGLLALGGAAAVWAGSAPYFEHEDARAAILAGEAAHVDPGTLADEQQRQQAARAAWESWGQVAVAGGAVATALGVSAVGVAVALAVE